MNERRYFAKLDPLRVVTAYRTHTQCPVAIADYDEEGIRSTKVVTAVSGDWIITQPDGSLSVQCDSSFRMLYSEMLEGSAR